MNYEVEFKIPGTISVIADNKADAYEVANELIEINGIVIENIEFIDATTEANEKANDEDDAIEARKLEDKNDS